jgi:cobalt transporter subunit CbtA
MAVFRGLVFAAALAGLAVGATITAMEHIGTLPLIAQAEVYEQHGAVGHSHGPDTQAPAAGAAAAAEHDHGGWEPKPGFQRNAYTALFNVVAWIGFGLCLGGALVLSRREINWRTGLLFGLAGFASFVLAPATGLPPELPGMPAGPLAARQAWWVLTVAATAGGLGLLALRASPIAAVAGLALVALPHLVGAPGAPGIENPIPEALSRDFVVTVLVTNFFAWALLGTLMGLLAPRFGLAPKAAVAPAG